MSPLKTKKARTVAVTCAVIALAGIVAMLSYRPGGSPRENATGEGAPPPIGAEASEPSKQPEADFDAGVDIAELVEQSQTLKPIQWEPPKVDYSKSRFSPEDLEKAKRIMGRYYGNFERISTLSLHQETRESSYVQNETSMRYLEARHGIDNMTVDVEAARSPLYFKITGTAGGKKVSDIVTPAGKISGGMMGMGESWVPVYMDGETGFLLPTTIFALGSRVREDVAMEYDLPGLEEYTRRAREGGARYDVIEIPRKGVTLEYYGDLLRELWFNRETGMPDFVVEHKVPSVEGESPFYTAQVYEYKTAGGATYPSHTFGFALGYGVKMETFNTRLVINGQSPEGSE